MSEQKPDFIPPESDGLETQLTPEQLETLKKGIEQVAGKPVSQQDSEPVRQQTVQPKSAMPNKYPSNMMCRCIMRFFFQNGTEYKNEINVTMDRIQMIQNQMTNSLENKDGNGVIYLEGSKNCEADFTVIPVKNILYVKFEVEDFRKV